LPHIAARRAVFGRLSGATQSARRIQLAAGFMF
jgi:hypothetical protein